MSSRAQAGEASRRQTDAEAELESLANPEDALFLQRFFKTAAGQYGEGDRFLGIRVPVLRRLAKKYGTLPLDEVSRLLHAPFHEARLLALLILVRIYDRGDAALREQLFTFYLENTACINNWDLVDASAEHIVGRHLRGGSVRPLVRLARSKVVWERRIAIIATYHFIKLGTLAPTLQIAELLLGDSHDLIHKAVGWMLREVGKRDRQAAEDFLRSHCRSMPRTMLRYAIERFPPELRRAYLRGDV